MEIRSTALNPVQTVDVARQRAESISSSARFMDVLAMMQNDGVIAQNATARVDALSAEQKETLRDSFDIADVRGMSGRRALLNELVGLGVLSAEESELSMMQLLPPSSGGLSMGAGWEAGAGFEEMLNDPSYLNHLKRAMEFDGLWGRSPEVTAARQRVYDVLKDVFL